MKRSIATFMVTFAVMSQAFAAPHRMSNAQKNQLLSDVTAVKQALKHQESDQGIKNFAGGLLIVGAGGMLATSGALGEAANSAMWFRIYSGAFVAGASMAAAAGVMMVLMPDQTANDDTMTAYFKTAKGMQKLFEAEPDQIMTDIMVDGDDQLVAGIHQIAQALKK